MFGTLLHQLQVTTKMTDKTPRKMHMPNMNWSTSNSQIHFTFSTSEYEHGKKRTEPF